MYLVEYSTGSWDSWTRKPHFVTDDEQKAKDYCEKFNRILAAARTFYLKDDDEFYMKNDHLPVWFHLRQHHVNDYNEAKYAPIEIR